MNLEFELLCITFGLELELLELEFDLLLFEKDALKFESFQKT
jgi:hypothetical protein